MSVATQATPRHAVLITVSVMLASLLYSIDWTIAAVALPHMQGTFSATQDQTGWIITSYIVASAISISTSGWLSTRFGRKRVFVHALSAFMVASVFCGAAESLAVEVLARIAQGMSGAFLIPLSHAVILDTYPPAEQGKAMALWGTGSVMGSFIGPTLGGYLTEHLSWHYIFYINLPFGLLALLGIVAFVPETVRDPGRRLDGFGFLTLALGIGSLQLMLDRGGRLDWFDSPEIVVEAWLAALGLYLFAAHSLTTREPFLDPRLVMQRGFFIGLIFVFLYGLLTVPPIVLMPPFLADVRGYPIDTIGLLQAPRGFGLLAAMIVGGRVTGRIDSRILIAFGLFCIAASGWEMSTWNADVGEWPLVWTNFVQGVGGGIILVPIQAIAFPALAPERRTEAAAVFNLVRSIGASIGVSTALTLFVQASSANHARLTEHVTRFRETLRFPAAAAQWSLASPEGFAVIEREIDRQAAMLAYAGDFRTLAMAALAGLPLLLLLGRQRQGPNPLEPPETA
jgi:DHA2 family multidrug resistance protein